MSERGSLRPVGPKGITARAKPMLRARDWRKFQGSRPDHSVPAWRAGKANNDTCSHCLLEQKARTFAFGTLFVHTHSQVPLAGSIPALRSGGPLPSGRRQLPDTTVVPAGQRDTQVVLLLLPMPTEPNPNCCAAAGYTPSKRAATTVPVRAILVICSSPE